MMNIDMAEIDGDNKFAFEAHYNLGTNGYGYGFRCIAYPRLKIIEWYYKGTFAKRSNTKQRRAWFVDGIEVSTIELAISYLKNPPILTPDEERILADLNETFVDLRAWEDTLKGPLRTKGMNENEASVFVHRLIDGLRDKGVVELGKEPWPEDYKPEMDFENMRWSPTIRKREQQT